jgi:hypothetical protein
MVENLKIRGGSLIEELKNHIVYVVRANSRRGTLSLEELRELSGIRLFSPSLWNWLRRAAYGVRNRYGR